MSITCRHCGRDAPAKPKLPYICPCGKSGAYDSGDLVTAQAIAFKQAGGPAFPTTKPLEGWGDPNQGMTLRDYFAGQALIGLFACEANPRVGRDVEPYNCGEAHREYTAREAYALADAMLAERAK